MKKLCDICMSKEATRQDRIVSGNATLEFSYCENCYQAALSMGIPPYELAKKRLARRGSECYSCSYTAEEFEKSFLMRCPDCYRNMRAKARASAAGYFEAHRASERLFGVECDADILKNLAVSSRIRLARNVEGMPFKASYADGAQNISALFDGAVKAAKGAFDCELYQMSELSTLKKKALIELHVISLPLANSPLGAVAVEKGDDLEMSVMLNEEDRIRTQCVKDGFDLVGAYEKARRYDENLRRQLPIAYDEEFGYLTACPSNLGTGMRASIMLFLPALVMTGAINEALEQYRRRYGLTVRGYFGEGSDGAYSMYQISNSIAFNVSEREIICSVQNAAIDLCRLETSALEKVLRENKTQLIDKIFRSYGLITSAYSLSANELMQTLIDVKLGVILGVLPIHSMTPLNDLILACASSFEILTDGITEEERNVKRASIVRKRLEEVK